METSAPDTQRLGGIGWLERTSGSLTSAERRRLVVPILRGQAQGIAGRLALLTGRRTRPTLDLPTPPDSAMAREAEQAAADQPATLLGHAYRTWAFGAALATVDAAERGGPQPDAELFYVAALVHDVGLVEAVTGEDFTLRSGAAASPIVAAHRGPDSPDIDLVRDAISAHTTPGANLEHDGAQAFYVQAGAVCDLGGLRLHHLSEQLVRDVLDRHPRRGVTCDIIERIRAEAAAVPEGRFALLRRTGFTVAIRLAPLPDDARPRLFRRCARP